MTGAPLLVEPKINNSASIGDEVMNFSFTVRGPRGTMNVELGADSRLLKDIGMSQASKEFAKTKGIPVSDNIYNQSYNNYYILDQSVIKSMAELEEKDLKGKINPDTKFWMIEYLYAEIEDGMKVMIAPKPVSEKKEPIVL